MELCIRLLTTLTIFLTFACVVRVAAANTSQPRHISPQREHVVRLLNIGLVGTPMAETGRELEAAGWKHHVHPALIAAIAGTESSFGRAACRGNPRNAFGLSSCNRGWHVPYFRSWAHAYTFMAIFLSSRWRGATSPYSYRGYAACTPCWARKVAWYMAARFGVTTARYGGGHD